jgi:two-component system, NtrC family, response regulator AtoC
MSDSGALVYVVDDDASAREGVAALIRSAGLTPKTFASAEEFLVAPRSEGPSCLVLDVSLPGVSGLDLQQKLAKSNLQIPIIFLTGRGDIPMTVRALKAGAANFLTKPFDDDDLLNSIHQCMKVAALERRARTLEESLKSARSELHDRYGFEQILGRSSVLRETLTRAAQVAQTETTALITGESGTGKELVARAIHHASPRADGPFVAVNCAALPDTLLESELFGHERGAFTGADRQKPGRFELAAHGTLFLDEIGELSPAVQVKLLRVLQEREFQRVGGTATLKADVRLIAATNRDLAAEMAAGRFRSDLFYRLSVFNVHLPALRERGDDVLLLADTFIRTLAVKMGKGDVTLSRDALDVLRQHPWPGNIRELQNAIERGLITCEGTLVTAAHLAIPLAPERIASPPPSESPPAADSVQLHELERKAIVEALHRTRGHKARAAALLGLTRFQLYSRLKREGIEMSLD